MMMRLAVRWLAVRPVRTAVLACGFGLGIAVMAELLGVGEVILDQARSPALQGGGDVVVTGAFGPLESARFVMTGLLAGGEMKRRIAAVAPSRKATLYLIRKGEALSVVARGGVPSLEKAVGDPEVADALAWQDAPGDERWAHPDAGDVFRAMDRFHARPDVPEFARSWAEWLYFNGRTSDGRVRFYLTYLVSPADRAGICRAGVRLQLDRGGRITNYAASTEVDERSVLAEAPNLDIGGNRVALEGMRYRMTLRLPGERGGGSNATGEVVLEAPPGRSLPPTVVHGARGWISGYVVPVLSGSVRGALTVDGEAVPLDGASGYHDHNWGFWQDVRWQWGQVAHDDLSFIYGRVFPPASVADPDRAPGFLGLVGPDGPVGVATHVTIAERGPDTAPDEIVVGAHGEGLELGLTFSVDRLVRSQLGRAGPGSAPMDFLQLGGLYHVTGRAGGRSIDFTSRGAAETFRPVPPSALRRRP